MVHMASVQEDWVYDKILPSDLDIGHAAIEELLQALNAAGWDGADLFRIQMAIEEAVVNAIEHGNQKDQSKKVHVVFRVNPEQVWMQVTDEGNGFDHRNVADPTVEELLDKPRGRGVMLIRELMSEAIYNECGNQLTIIKLRSAPTPPESDD
jgi:serine/threonine-protein kinase RsbW